MSIRLLALFLVAVAFAILPTRAAAQAATATLAGVVVDESGAVVPDVGLTLVNADTSLQRKTTATSGGGFTFPFVLPGRYTITAERDGFSPSQVTGVVLNVGDNVALRIALKVGSVTDIVSVVANAQPVTQSAAVATTVDQQFIENQPLNGRSFQTLLRLAPGVVLTPTGVGSQGQFSVNGQRPSTNTLTVDGVSANVGISSAATLYESAGGNVPAYTLTGTTPSIASIDAVQEFTIQTSTFAPEFGRQPGAQISVVTRSGTNQFHGSGFEYFRDDALDANNWFAKQNGLGKTPLRQHDFGGVLGGPIAANRTFFFVSHETLKLAQPVISGSLVVPSLEARQAATGLAREVMEAFPQPNRPGPATDPDAGIFIGADTSRTTLHATSLRIDHAVSPAHALFARFNHAPSSGKRRDFGNGGGAVMGTSLADADTVTAGVTSQLSPRLLNDLRVNWSRSRAGTSYAADTFGGATPPSAGFLFPSFADATNGFSYVQLGTSSVSVGSNADNLQRQLNIVDTLSWSLGAHALKVGIDYRQMTPVARGATFRRFLFYSSVAQIASGTIPSGSLSLTDINLEPIFTNFSAFVQDTWTASPRFTVTYGARYDVNPAPSERNGNLPYTVQGLDEPTTLQLAPLGDRFYETSYGNIAPRVGIAWQPRTSASTVVRGGAGLFYDLGYTFFGAAMINTAVPFGRSVTFPANTPLGAPITTTAPPAFSATPTPPYGAVFAFEPGYELPYTWQYNLSMEQQVGRVGSLTIGYVGARGHRLGRVERLRNPNPNFTLVSVARNAASSQYDALQAQFRRRLSGGVQALVSYTLGRSLDEVSDESITNYQGPLTSYDPSRDWGPSSFDARHSLSAAISVQAPSPARGVLKAVLGGWATDAIYSFRSATPVNILTGTDPFGFGYTTVGRPDVVPGESFYIDDASAPGGRRLNGAAFVAPPAGQQGTLGRNAVRGFAASQLDLAIRRDVPLHNRVRAQVRVDVFNVFDRVNFANPIGIMTNPSFGVSTQLLAQSYGGLSALYAPGGPRSTQVSLKVLF